MTTYSLPLSKKKRAVKTRPPRDALFIAAACVLDLITSALDPRVAVTGKAGS
jgi:hypothetical protein